MLRVRFVVTGNTLAELYEQTRLMVARLAGPSLSEDQVREVVHAADFDIRPFVRTTDTIATLWEADVSADLVQPVS